MVTVVVGGAIQIGKIGLVRLPDGISLPRTQWEFGNPSTPDWQPLTQTRMFRSGGGLLLIPGREPAAVSSGPIDLDIRDYRNIRLRFQVRSPADGVLRFRLWSVEGARWVAQQVSAAGGDTFEEIRGDLTWGWASGERIKEIIFTPSLVPQAVMVSDVELEPANGLMLAALQDLVSSFPGVVLAERAVTINTVSPPSIKGRSIWAVLIPMVFVMAAIVSLVPDMSTEWAPVAGRIAWMSIVGVWVIGFAFLLYYQAVALKTDLVRFRGWDRSVAYAAVDGAPLYSDLADAVSRLPPGSGVTFSTDQGGFSGMILKARSRYYLYPRVESGASFRFHYFASDRRACHEVMPDAAVISEAERFCLFRVPQ
ncbi:MAG: hypothetical protein HY207_05940 [Nitrospirae bacterium]|nr:hypothetical protein [Nitrospirota bacterium]